MGYPTEPSHFIFSVDPERSVGGRGQATTVSCCYLSNVRCFWCPAFWIACPERFVWSSLWWHSFTSGKHVPSGNIFAWLWLDYLIMSSSVGCFLLGSFISCPVFFAHCSSRTKLFLICLMPWMFQSWIRKGGRNVFNTLNHKWLTWTTWQIICILFLLMGIQTHEQVTSFDFKKGQFQFEAWLCHPCLHPCLLCPWETVALSKWSMQMELAKFDSLAFRQLQVCYKCVFLWDCKSC